MNINGTFNFIADFNSLYDTLFVDTALNTVSNQYAYKVELYYGIVPQLKGSSLKASSVFLSIAPTDNRLNLSWTEHVPWTNSSYDVFRFNGTGWDSIATTVLQHYSDSGLTNGTQYCYYIRSIGAYTSPGILTPLVNLSQEVCSTPLDNVPPCAPDLLVSPKCFDLLNVLTWSKPDTSCGDDIQYYNIYFYSPDAPDYVFLGSVSGADDTVFMHEHLASLAGCYKVKAVDSTGNESTDAIEFCVDSCRDYMLPSVFTPDGDGLNDFFHPCDQTTDPELQAECPPYKNVKDVDMKIFNRWGSLVFETANRDILWDGKNQQSKNDCPDGVYYYVCKVNFYRLVGTESKVLHGYVHLIRNN